MDVKKFKNITGYKLADVAEVFGTSRQFMSAEINNHSLTHKAAMAFYLTTMIDLKILQHEQAIKQLEGLKSEIKAEVKK